jgi:RNA polymerase-binding transcription factor DksA
VTAKKTTAKKAPPAAPNKSKPGERATVEAILGVSRVGPAPGGPLRKQEWAKFQKRLLELRERLLNQMSGLAKESAVEMESYSLHMADEGTDDFALSLLSSDQDAIYEIDEALKRMERGTFGICELTQKPIPKARLEAVPWARFTVEAQAQLEREGALRQRRLGALGTVDAIAPPEPEEEVEEEEKPPKEKE